MIDEYLLREYILNMIIERAYRFFNSSARFRSKRQQHNAQPTTAICRHNSIKTLEKSIPQPIHIINLFREIVEIRILFQMHVPVWCIYIIHTISHPNNKT